MNWKQTFYDADYYLINVYRYDYPKRGRLSHDGVAAILLSYVQLKLFILKPVYFRDFFWYLEIKSKSMSALLKENNVTRKYRSWRGGGCN